MASAKTFAVVVLTDFADVATTAAASERAFKNMLKVCNNKIKNGRQKVMKKNTETLPCNHNNKAICWPLSS